MKIWTDKQGNKLTLKEFGARFKAGVNSINPYQLTTHQLRGMKIIMFGLLCGIVICFLNLKVLWWLLIILVGGLYVNGSQYIGLWQKKQGLKKFYDVYQGELIDEKEVKI